MKTLEFYFDFASPYSYLAYHHLQNIAQTHQAKIIYHPILLGAVFKATNNTNSPTTVPAKLRYLLKDLQRWAAYHQIDFQMNPHFPVNSLDLMRVATALQIDDPERFEQFVGVIYNAMFAQPINFSDPAALSQVLATMDMTLEQFQALASRDDVKQALRLTTEHAVARGVFGAPTFFVGEEMFWGQDRLDFVARALEKPN